MADKDSTSNRTTPKVYKAAPQAHTRRKTKATSDPKVVANIVHYPLSAGRKLR